MRNGIAILLAMVAGMALASYDTRTDDSAIEVGLVLIVSLGLAFMAPKLWWVIALLVGGFIPLVEIGFSLVPGARVPPGIAAVGVALVGALIGFGIARASRVGPA